jgi:MYXO-CTERM domain-containing protein
MKQAPRGTPLRHGLPALVMAGAAGVAGLLVGLLASSPSEAMHEIDHRFTVEGYVCGSDGQPVKDLSVTVKDARVDIRMTAVTDDRGYYKATLHLHNDNRGDPIVVTAKDQEKKTTALFDVKDVKTERIATVNFGTGCEAGDEGPRPWVYYTAGIGLAMVAAFAGARFVKARRKPQKRGKGHRK